MLDTAVPGRRGGCPAGGDTVSGLRALTIRQPWAWAILHGKPVENRTWPPPHWLTEVAIHAGARSGWDEDGEFSPLVQAAWRKFAADPPPMNTVAPLGPGAIHIGFSAIAAVAEGLSSHHASDCCGYCSEWAVQGQFHWQWRTLRVLAEPVPAKGALGLWKVPDDIESAVRAQLEARDA